MPLTPDDVRTVRFTTAAGVRTGYRPQDVDELLDAVAERMTAGAPVAELVRAAVFTPVRRGYDEGQVDAFLELVADADAGADAARGAQPPGSTTRPSTPTTQDGPAPFLEQRSWLDRLRGRR